MSLVVRRAADDNSVSRYFFHIFDSIAIVDKEGTELKTLAAARTEAVSRTGRYLLAAPEAVWHSEAWHMEVTDGNGFLYFRLDLNVSASQSLSS
ncbi:MAG: DUF6894 family protein [Caulobacteraceae bacterium]